MELKGRAEARPVGSPLVLKEVRVELKTDLGKLSFHSAGPWTPRSPATVPAHGEQLGEERSCSPSPPGEEMSQSQTPSIPHIMLSPGGSQGPCLAVGGMGSFTSEKRMGFC